MQEYERGVGSRVANEAGSVAFLTTTLSRGGTEQQIVRVAAALRSRGWRVVVYYLTGSNALQTDLLTAGVDVQRVDLDNAWQIPAVIIRLVRSLRIRGVTSLVTMLFHADVLGSVVARLVRIPQLIRSVRSTGTGGWARELGWRLTRRWVNWSVANSAATLRANVSAGVISGRKCSIISNAIDVEDYSRRTVGRDAMRHFLGVMPYEFVWVAVGAQRDEKNYPELLRAFASLRELPCRLLIAGKAWQQDALDRLAKELGVGVRFRQLGDVADVPQLLAAADGLVLASRFEGMPNSVLEGMAAGLPVVTTDVGGVRDFVDDSVGRVVAVGDRQALSAALVDVANLPPEYRKQMGSRARTRVEQMCGLNSIVDRWEALLRQGTLIGGEGLRSHS